jgi:polyferredoxin
VFRTSQIVGPREDRLVWAVCALAITSFGYATYVLMAWSPATASPSDLPIGLVALGFYAAAIVLLLIALLLRTN